MKLKRLTQTNIDFFIYQHFINMENELPRLPSMASLAKIAEAVANAAPEEDDKLWPSATNVMGVIIEYQNGLRAPLKNANCVCCAENFIDDSFVTGAAYFDDVYPVLNVNEAMLYLFVKDKFHVLEIQKHVKFLELLRKRITLDGIAVMVKPMPKFFS